MKKVLCLLLSIIMLLSISTGIELSAYAGGWLNHAKDVELNMVYTEFASASDNRYEVFRFEVPCSGKVSIHAEAEDEQYLTTQYANGNNNSANYGIVSYDIYSDADIENRCWTGGEVVYLEYSKSRGLYYVDYNVTLPQGKYYLVIEYIHDSSWYYGTYDIFLGFTPSISKPSNFKVSTRKTTSLKLTWNKASGVSGYQLQRKSGGSYKTVANTTATSYTVSNLKSATAYTFRVRAYKKVNGTKYYSGWTTLTTPTKPGTPSIKAPTTNKKHQIIAKWNSVARASGYQVQYSKKKNFSSVIATKTVSGQSKTSYTGNNFTKGKTYYVRVRAYKTVNGTKYYGVWSKVKSIKSK